MLGNLDGQHRSSTGPTVTALMASMASKGEALRDFREVHQEGALDTSFAFPFPVPLSSPPSLNPCRPRRSSHLWKESGDNHQLPSQVEPLLEGILETSLLSPGSPPLKSGSSQLSIEHHSGNDSFTCGSHPRHQSFHPIEFHWANSTVWRWEELRSNILPFLHSLW